MHVIPVLALLSACTAGVGPVGVDIIAQREDPNGGLGSSSSSSSGSVASGLNCSGSYTCAVSGTDSYTSHLTQKSEGCEATIPGDTLLLTSDGKISQGGTAIGTWRTSGSTVTVCTTANECATCSPESGSTLGSDSGVGTSPTDAAGQ